MVFDSAGRIKLRERVSRKFSCIVQWIGYKKHQVGMRWSWCVVVVLILNPRFGSGFGRHPSSSWSWFRFGTALSTHSPTRYPSRVVSHCSQLFRILGHGYGFVLPFFLQNCKSMSHSGIGFGRCPSSSETEVWAPSGHIPYFISSLYPSWVISLCSYFGIWVRGLHFVSMIHSGYPSI